MNKKTIIISTIVFLVALIAVAGLSVFTKNSNAVPKADSDSSTTPVASAPASPKTSDKAKEKEIEEQKKDFEENILGEESGEMKALPNFSEDEVRSAVDTSIDYGRQAVSNRYFLSGQWLADGADVDIMVNSIQGYFSADAVEEFRKYEPTPEYSDRLTALSFFFNTSEGSGIKPAPACLQEIGEDAPKETTSGCPISTEISDVSYGEVEIDGEKFVQVALKSTAVIPVIEVVDGAETEVNTKVVYDYDMLLTPNLDTSDEEGIVRDFVIDKAQVDWSSEKFKG